MANEALHPTAPLCLHLVSAFLAMEPTDSLITLARKCGGGVITERVQIFIWENCISKYATRGYAPYLKKFLKRLITEVESNNGVVLDELYEKYAYYITSLKDDNMVKRNSRVCKCISFLFPDGCSEAPSCPSVVKLMVPLQCSLNILEGDTGCAIWPSSLLLSEFVLSFPEVFSNKSCFEAILSDGDLSSLDNLKSNLELNQLNITSDMLERSTQVQTLVKCIYLPWESASESELQDLKPDIILGADVIYDPACLPHLIRLLTIILRKKPFSHQGKVNSNGQSNAATGAPYAISSFLESETTPVAYIASVIRNMDTFSYFLKLADQANLHVLDITDTVKPVNMLPYMQSYDRTSVRLFSLSYNCLS